MAYPATTPAQYWSVQSSAPTKGPASATKNHGLDSIRDHASSVVPAIESSTHSTIASRPQGLSLHLESATTADHIIRLRTGGTSTSSMACRKTVSAAARSA